MFNTRKVNSHTSPKHTPPVCVPQSHTEPVKDEGGSQSRHHNSGDVGKVKGEEKKRETKAKHPAAKPQIPTAPSLPVVLFS
jgi:hypothetical protein